MTMYSLPIRCTHNMRPVGANDTDGGWTSMRFPTLARMQQFMQDYPRSFMPCWKRLANEGAHLFAVTS